MAVASVLCAVRGFGRECTRVGSKYWFKTPKVSFEILLPSRYKVWVKFPYWGVLLFNHAN